MTGERCARCGKTGPLEVDHPTGVDARGKHLHPHFVVPLCADCHRVRSLLDRRIGVEGPIVAAAYLADSRLALWLICRRVSGWAGCLATARRPVTLNPDVLGALADVLADACALADAEGLSEPA